MSPLNFIGNSEQKKTKDIMDIPKHIAIIMDGNGRWAREHHLARILGYKKGAERVKEIVKEAKKAGVKVLTLFAFSTENWHRPRKEIEFIFSYLAERLKKDKGMLTRESIKLNFIGRRDRLGESLKKNIHDIETLTNNFCSLILNVALDYGGRWDIIRAAKRMAKDVIERKVSLADINEKHFGRYISLAEYREPDLLIRTSGELRISNFLLWQLAYSELYFTKVYWPDFDKNELSAAISDYAKRKRRFGSTK